MPEPGVGVDDRHVATPGGAQADRAGGAATAADAVSVISRLGGRIDEIGKILSVIDDVSEQTNLLALNAAIEAARAGEHGRGFAVVADEVRKLAERTRQATKEIAGMIATIQVETTAAVDVMGQGRGSVEGSMALAEEAGAALTRIVEATERTEDMIRQIAAASEEQSATSEQIARSVAQISSESETAASGIARIAGGIDTLDGLTTELRSLVARFRTGAPEAAPAVQSGDGAARRSPAVPVVAPAWMEA